jgi:hypothetical protein
MPSAGHRGGTEGNEGNEEAAWCGGADWVGAGSYLDSWTLFVRKAQ